MTSSVEERLSQLEQKVDRLLGEQAETMNKTPWWKKIVGVYKDDLEFDEAMRLGREYRESLRPKENEDVA